MRRAERPLGQQPRAGRERAGHRVDGRAPRAPPRTSKGGRMPGSRRASIVLPAPGGPIISRLWPPAAATSSARRAKSLPAQVSEVQRHAPPVGRRCRGWRRRRPSLARQVEQRDRLGERAHRQQAQPIDHGGFGGVAARQQQRRRAAPAGRGGNRQHAAGGVNGAVERRARRRCTMRGCRGWGPRRWPRGCRGRSAGRTTEPALRTSAGARLMVMRCAGSRSRNCGSPRARDRGSRARWRRAGRPCERGQAEARRRLRRARDRRRRRRPRRSRGAQACAVHRCNRVPRHTRAEFRAIRTEAGLRCRRVQESPSPALGRSRGDVALNAAIGAATEGLLLGVSCRAGWTTRRAPMLECRALEVVPGLQLVDRGAVAPRDGVERVAGADAVDGGRRFVAVARPRLP